MAWGHDHHDRDQDLHFEESHRRRLWWTSLTEEERALETRRQRATDWWFTCTFGLTASLVLLYAALVYWEVFHHGIVDQILAFVAFPVGLVLSGVFALYKRGQVR